MCQVPLIRLGDIHATWNFYFIHKGNCHTERVLFNGSNSRVIPGECDQRAKARLASQASSFRCFMACMKRLLILQLFGALVAGMAHAATNFDLAAKATNEFAVDLQ